MHCALLWRVVVIGGSQIMEAFMLLVDYPHDIDTQGLIQGVDGMAI